MKVGDLVTFIDDSYCHYYHSCKRYLIVEEYECSDKSFHFRLRRMSDGYKTGWVGDISLKKLNKTNITIV